MSNTIPVTAQFSVNSKSVFPRGLWLKVHFWYGSTKLTHYYVYISVGFLTVKLPADFLVLIKHGSLRRAFNLIWGFISLDNACEPSESLCNSLFNLSLHMLRWWCSQRIHLLSQENRLKASRIFFFLGIKPLSLLSLLPCKWVRLLSPAHRTL